MKKVLMGLIGAMMILSLAACTPTTNKNKKEPEASVKTSQSTDKSQLANGVDYDRSVDSTAPDLSVVAIYSVTEDGKGLKGTMESVPEDDMGAEELVNILMEYGVLEEGTEVLLFDTDDELTSDEAVGPGVSKDSGTAVKTGISATGVLDLNQIPDDVMTIHAVARTFMENMNVESLTIQVDGETVAENLTADDVE
jgi:hypothetical protein